MANIQSANRLTCFALVSAIESDIREYLASNEFLPRQFLPKDTRDTAIARTTHDRQSSGVKLLDDDRYLLDYVDFGDLAKALRTGRIGFVDTAGAHAVAARLEELVPARNRVCHSRPLEADDFSQLHELATTAPRLWPEARWRETQGTLDRLTTEPTFVFRLQIPQFWREESSKLAENLPLPEFDDTGFLGRSVDRRELNKVLVSAHPVVSVVGAGGVGKTALAVRCLYDIVDASDCPFDALAWVSLKTQVLTATGAVEVRDAVREVLGAVQSAAGQLGSPDSTGTTIESCFAEILAYMKHFKVLLAIDNLETVGWGELRPFLAAIPPGSKVLITSRVGLGEFEHRYALEGLDDKTAVDLARRFAKAVNCTLVAQQPEQELVRACRLLYRNPLLLKWYISAVNAGAQPSRLLDKAGAQFQDALRFCFSSLFDRLEPAEKLIVHVLASAQRPLSIVELAYAMRDQSDDKVQWALNTLHNGSILRRSPSRDGGEPQYALTESASEYVSRFAPPAAETYAQVSRTLRELRKTSEASAKRKQVYKYDPFAIEAGTRDQELLAPFLVKALRHANSERFDAAKQEIEQARRLLATFPDLHRVSGMVHAASGDSYRAAQDFELAAELAPKSAAIRYHYWSFLQNVAEDYEHALRQIDMALQVDPADATLRTARAQTLARLGRYKEACALYDVLVVDLSDRDRRWRIITRDQAAECYRRFAEQRLAAGEDGSAQSSLANALNILVDGAQSGDVDEHTPHRVGKIVEDSMRFAVTRKDVGAARELVRLVERLAGRVAGPIQVSSWTAFVELFGAGLPETASLSRLFKGASNVLEGTVARILLEKGFGFLRGDDGREWYFHRSALIGGSPWERVEPGARVAFKLGVNAKGACAIEVVLRSADPPGTREY